MKVFINFNLLSASMKRVVLLFAVMASLLLLFSGCSKGPVCNEPYILVGNDCCLDRNGNDICDKDETAAPYSPIAEPGSPSAEEIPEAVLSEQPNIAKFNGYLFSASLGKLPIGVRVGPSNFPVKTSIFSKATDTFCTNLEIKKLIPSGSWASAVYDTNSRQYIQPKSVFPIELKAGGSSGCSDLTMPPGNYENKLYIDDVLIAVLPFEVK